MMSRENIQSMGQMSTINNDLVLDLRDHFPIGENTFYGGLFAFSNDCNFPSVLSSLKRSRTEVSDKKTKVAFLVGPTNLPSMLPELYQHGVDVILSVDIDFRVHKHNQHMLSCIEQSDTPKDFIKRYLINNPADGYRLPGIPGGLLSPLNYYCKDTFLTMLTGDDIYVIDLGKYHFLSSVERYSLCKASLSQVVIERLTLDLMNEGECLNLASILQRNNAELVFCNFTNIHEYDKNKTLSSSLVALTHTSSQYHVMFSKRIRENLFTAELSSNMNEYFKSCLNDDYETCKENFLKKEMPQTVNFSSFTKQDETYFKLLSQGNILMFNVIEEENKKNIARDKNKENSNQQDDLGQTSYKGSL